MNLVKIYSKSIAIPVILGGIVGLIISSSIDYNFVEKPFLAPPAIAFPIVWTLLYILMGVSYGILKSKEKIKSQINWIYAIQLGVNLLWPIFFFLAKWRLFAFLWIVLLAILVLIMVVKFYQQEKIAGLLQIPYLLWVIFASYLNLSIYLLNQ